MLAIVAQTAGPNCLKLFEAKILDIEFFLDQIFFSKFDFFSRATLTKIIVL